MIPSTSTVNEIRISYSYTANSQRIPFSYNAIHVKMLYPCTVNRARISYPYTVHKSGENLYQNTVNRVRSLYVYRSAVRIPCLHLWIRERVSSKLSQKSRIPYSYAGHKAGQKNLSSHCKSSQNCLFRQFRGAIRCERVKCLIYNWLSRYILQFTHRIISHLCTYSNVHLKFFQ